MAFNLANAVPVKSGFDLSRAVEADEDTQVKQIAKEDEGILTALNNAAKSNPLLQGLAEFQGGINRGAAGLIDFFTTDQINSILEISGSEKRVPTLRKTLGGSPEMEGGFMQEGLAKDVVGAAGQIIPTTLAAGGIARTAARSLPAISQGESALVGATRELGKVTPLQDVTLGAVSGAGGAVGEDVGGETGKLVGSIVAPVGGGALVAGGRGLARAAGEEIPQDLQQAFSRGNVMTSDVMPPETFIGKSLQRLGERVPFIGTGKVRAGQQKEREQAIRDFASDFDITADAPFEAEIVNAATGTFKKSRERASELRAKAVPELKKGGGVSTLNTREAIAEEIARQKALGQKADQTLIKSLEDTQASLEGDFEHVQNIRTAVLNEITDIGRNNSAIASGGDAALERVRGALTKDLKEFADDYSKQATDREGALAASRWKASNRLFADGFSKARETELKRIFTKGEVTPEVVKNIVKGGKRSELRRLYEYGGIEGRDATKKLILQDAIERSGGFNNTNPTQLLNKLNEKNTRTAADIFFTGSAKRELDGLKKYLDLTRRAQEANVATPTGQEAVTVATGAGAFAEPTVVLPLMAVTGGGARVFESGTVRNLLIKLNAAKTPREEAAILNQLRPAMIQAAQQEKPEEDVRTIVIKKGIPQERK
jgi:hypothetical protein